MKLIKMFVLSSLFPVFVLCMFCLCIENVERSSSTVTVIAAVVGSLLLGFVFGLLVFGFIWRRRQQSNYKGTMFSSVICIDVFSFLSNIQ